MFSSLGPQTRVGDEAFYYFYQDFKLHGAVLTHVDDFTVAETEEFLEKILDGVTSDMTVSNVEKNSFRFSELNVKMLQDSVKITMQDCMTLWKV